MKILPIVILFFMLTTNAMAWSGFVDYAFEDSKGNFIIYLETGDERVPYRHFKLKADQREEMSKLQKHMQVDFTCGKFSNKYSIMKSECVITDWSKHACERIRIEDQPEYMQCEMLKLQKYNEDCETLMNSFDKPYNEEVFKKCLFHDISNDYDRYCNSLISRYNAYDKMAFDYFDRYGEKAEEMEMEFKKTIAECKDKGKRAYFREKYARKVLNNEVRLRKFSDNDPGYDVKHTDYVFKKDKSFP